MTDQQYTTILALLSRIADALESKSTPASAQMDDEAKAAKMECPECGGHMTLRRSKKNGSAFAGCTRWPECSGIRWMNGETPKARGAAKPKNATPAASAPPESPQDDVPF